MRCKSAQISVEYLIIVGFITFVLIGIIGIAFFYSGSIRDSIKMNQVSSLASKIISSSERVFYAGEPSKTVVSGYLPEGVDEIQIIENSLIFTVETGSGISKISFSSNVPILGTLESSKGLKKIKIEAKENHVEISKA